MVVITHHIVTPTGTVVQILQYVNKFLDKTLDSCIMVSIVERNHGENQMSVASIIRDQISGKTLFMLGAKNLIAHENALSFRIRGSKAVNYIKITLNSSDLYDMEFGKVWGTKYTVKATHNDVYNDMMHNLIEKETGLYTKLF